MYFVELHFGRYVEHKYIAMSKQSPTLVLMPAKKSSSVENLNNGVYVKGLGNNRPQSIAVDGSTSHSLLAEMDSITRWHSDTNITLNPEQSLSRLSVDKTEFVLHEDEGVTIYWDIKESVSAKDWIGLYKSDETHPGKWIDYRNRGVSGSKKGELVWHFDRISSAFTAPETKVCFRYYHGNTGQLHAYTQSILVRNPTASSSHGAASLKRLQSVDSEAEIVHLVIQDIEAVHVRKGMFFNPDPYLKLRIEPGQDRAQPVLAHHYKDRRTTICENTTEPNWNNEIFHFMALPSDDLFMKVKDRFTTSRPTLLRFLGQVSVPVRQVMEKAKLGLTMSCQLSGRGPS
ncbi:HECW1 [Bugula neritina]|uniref:HECW1 n=1 Tax=Bugula neritina TaxID=10212 RepID=A0A7J7JHM6_BUGNE|nr:HECW1 [Bugula neritina]